MASIEVADAYVALHTKMQGAEKEIAAGLGGAGVDSEVDKAGKRAGGKFGAAMGGAALGGAAVAGAALAAAGIVTYLNSSVDAYKDAEQSQLRLSDAYAKFPAVTSVNIDALRDLNTELMNKTRFDDDALASGQAQLAQYGLTGEQIASLTPLMADYAAKTGVDVTTASEQLGKAMLGQGRALKGVGIDFQDTGSVAGNFEQVMAGLSTQVGGFAEKEGQSAAGMAERMANQFGELQEIVGGALVPVILKLQGAFLDHVMPVLLQVISAVADGMGPAFEFLGSLFAGFDFSMFAELLGYLSPLGIAFKLLQPVLPVLFEAFQQIAGVLGGVLAAVLPVIAQTFAALGQVLAGVIAAVLPVLVPLITQLVTMFGDLAAQVLPMLLPVVVMLAEVLGQVLAAVMPIIAALIGALMPILQALIPVVVAILGAFMPLISALVEALAPILTVVADILAAILVPVLGIVIGVIQVLAGVITWLVANVIAPYFQGVLIPIISQVSQAFQTGFGWLGGFFEGLWSGIVSGFRWFINTIIDGINGFIGALNTAGDFIATATGGAVDFSVPSIPRLAAGAYVQARAGGIVANIGEGRYDEVVLPLSPAILDRLSGGGGRGNVWHVTAPVTADPRLQMRQWQREADRKGASQ